MQAAVMGLGSWGTAFALVLADAGHDVRLWGRNPETVSSVQSSHAATPAFTQTSTCRRRSPRRPMPL